MSKGILSRPSNPITEEATKILGIKPINITLNDLKIVSNIIDMTAKTINKEPI
jgi:hypothetical protein